MNLIIKIGIITFYLNQIIYCLEVVRLHVLTAENQNRSFEIKYNQFEKNQFSNVCSEKSKPLLKFIVHGFSETWNMTYRWNWVNDMAAEMFKSSESSKLCVIAVDWKELAKGGDLISNYWKAISNMQIAADLLTEFFKYNKINEKNMHCIGFSLGAHMCGVFFQVYFDKFKIKPARITGLDPAGPLFDSKALTEKLDYDDAYFVDIIHTSKRFGITQNLGHMNFYQDNGPSKVNACDKIIDRFENQENVIIYEEEKNSKDYNDILITDEVDSISFSSVSSLMNYAKKFWNKIKDFFSKKPKRIFLKAHQFFGCSHLMSVRFFLYSINTCEFNAKYCDSISDFQRNNCFKINNSFIGPKLGYYADKTNDLYKFSRGDFFLITNDKVPYCLDPIKL